MRQCNAVASNVANDLLKKTAAGGTEMKLGL
jgi:hypothetical protein